MATRAKNSDIAKLVFEEIGLQKETVTFLIEKLRYNNINIFVEVEDGDITKLSKEYTEIVPGDIALLLGIKSWALKYEDEHTSLLTLLGEWEDQFSYESYMQAR